MAYVSQHATAARRAPRPTPIGCWSLFGDVLDTVERQYVTPVDDTKLIQSALDGMLTSLDPHSDYLDPEGFDDMRDQTRGEYGGLGLEVTSEDGVVKVISPIDDTPAAKRRPQARRLHHRGQRRERAGPVGHRRGQADARQARRDGDADHRAARSPIPSTSSWCARSSSRSRPPRSMDGDYGVPAGLRLQREDHRRGPGRLRRDQGQEPAHEGPDPRPAPQSGRPARPGGRRLRPVPRRRRDRQPARPRSARHRTLQRPARRHDRTACRWWC